MSNHTKIVIIGGGFIGLEAAESLVMRGVETTLVEKLDQVMLGLDYEMSVMVRRHIAEKGVTVRTSDGVVEFTGDGAGNLKQVVTENAVLDALQLEGSHEIQRISSFISSFNSTTKCRLVASAHSFSY